MTKVVHVEFDDCGAGCPFLESTEGVSGDFNGYRCRRLWKEIYFSSGVFPDDCPLPDKEEPELPPCELCGEHIAGGEFEGLYICGDCYQELELPTD